MTFDQIKYCILLSDVRAAKIYMQDKNEVASFNELNSEALANRIDEFLTKVPSKYYRIIGKKRQSQSDDSGTLWHYQSDEVVVPKIIENFQEDRPLSLPQGAMSPVEFERLRKELEVNIHSSLSKEFEHKHKERILKDREEKLSEKEKNIESLAGKASLVLESVLANLVTKFGPMVAPGGVALAGTEQNNDNESDLLSEEEQQKVEQSYELFTKVGLTPDQILEFAQILEQKPHLIQMLPKLKEF